MLLATGSRFGRRVLFENSSSKFQRSVAMGFSILCLPRIHLMGALPHWPYRSTKTNYRKAHSEEPGISSADPDGATDGPGFSRWPAMESFTSSSPPSSRRKTSAHPGAKVFRAKRSSRNGFVFFL